MYFNFSVGLPGRQIDRTPMQMQLFMLVIAFSLAPVAMARCFQHAVITGRDAYLAGLGQISKQANKTSPLTGFLDELR